MSITAIEILAELHRRGVELSPAGDRLRFRPKGAVSPDMIEVLKRHKGEILTVLQSRQSGTGYGLCPGPEYCAGCYAIPGGRFIHPPKGKPIDWTAWEPVSEKVQ